ncbi:lysophospholipid acyltransferase family protein [Gluconobacter cerinus]|uniref:lysophospholipid acyltransferase family protein n=1 Tax=Gluconobacter cerinus TaxID=38307 RepID=UPI001B8B439F|nr:lysophospholipid acyltransferase family protein [Gluconobacter cerinus]MBS1040404.1 lysophospholipid acyltransferase family protein [Gluconobacter cerinus]MBS1046629.1 lysophospholipid acyltransferase family protein [Gluconobacter cerinus]
MKTYPRRNPVIAALVSRGMRRGIKRHFNAVRLSGNSDVLRHRGPLIVCANHPGWWDPAVFAWLQHRFFSHCHGYGPMEVQALRKYPLLEKAGLIPVSPENPESLRHFLRKACKILGQGHVLWITPEGHFSDVRSRPIRLQAGFAHLARRVPSAMLVPLAIEYTFWNESRPELLLRFGDPVSALESTRTQNTTVLMEEALTTTMETLARDAMMRDPSKFRTLSQGTGGIGGLYDVGRRLRQWARGEAFQPRHDQ